jgi:uncharacterized protein (TIGR03435 family)
MQAFRIAIVFALSIALAAHAQSSRPQFEVASIKPAAPNSLGQLGRAPGGRLTATNVPLVLLIQNAYRVRSFQVLGGPSWMATERWDIEARPEEGSVTPPGPQDPNVPDLFSLRLQSLLEDRFKLQIHHETRELPVFELTVAKSGLKAKLADDQTPFRAGDQRGGISLMIGGGELRAMAVPFPNFVAALSGIVGRTVVDKTNLKGLYDITLKWMPDVGQVVGPSGPLPPGVQLPRPDPSAPSLVTALQEQLGLKLEGSKGPVEVLVIDSVSKPTEN